MDSIALPHQPLSSQTTTWGVNFSSHGREADLTHINPPWTFLTILNENNSLFTRGFRLVTMKWGRVVYLLTGRFVSSTCDYLCFSSFHRCCLPGLSGSTWACAWMKFRLSPPHLNLPLTRAETQRDKCGVILAQKKKEKVETSGPRLGYVVEFRCTF